jgi:hypothetical protein
MAEDNVNPKQQPKDKKEARSTKDKLGALSPPQKDPKQSSTAGRLRALEFSPSLDKADTLLIDNWGCDPELSLTGGFTVDSLVPGEEAVVKPDSPAKEQRPAQDSAVPKTQEKTVAQKPVRSEAIPSVQAAQAQKPVSPPPLAAQATPVPKQKPVPIPDKPGAARVNSGALPASPAPIAAKDAEIEKEIQEVIPEGSDVSDPESLAHLSEAALQVIAGNPRTSPSTLCWLAAHYNPEIRSTVARNCNALPETIWLLAKDLDQAVRLAIAEHLESDRDVLKALGHDPSPLVSWRAQNTLSLLGNSPSASTSNLPYDEPKMRSRSKRSAAKQEKNNLQGQTPEEVEFLLLVAQKSTTPGRRLKELAGHINPLIRAAVAENGNTPLEALWSLSRDSIAEVKVKLADNYNCPLEIIAALEKDRDQFVVWRARSVLSKLTGQNFPDVALEDEPRISPRLVHSH